MPRPTPCTASRTPNQSHKETLIQGPAPPAHGTYKATEDTPQSICIKAVERSESQCPDITYLTPTWRTDTNRKDREEPRVNLAEPSEECKENSPNTDEEGDDKDENLPVLERTVPQERPVLSVGLEERGQIPLYREINHTHPAQPVIAQHQREQEPQHQFTTEERIVEVRNFRRCLAVVICAHGLMSKSQSHPKISDSPGSPRNKRIMNKKEKAESGQTIQTIHQGVKVPGIALFSLSPQYHNAATQICCDPWTMHARRIHTSVAAPASSPKLRPKKAKPPADATAYAQVATEERISCAGSSALLI